MPRPSGPLSHKRVESHTSRRNRQGQVARRLEESRAQRLAERRRKRSERLLALSQRQMVRQMQVMDPDMRRSYESFRQEMEAQCPGIDERWRRYWQWINQEYQKCKQEYEARRPQMEETLRQNQQWLNQELEKHRREYEARRPEIKETLRRNQQWINRELE